MDTGGTQVRCRLEGAERHQDHDGEHDRVQGPGRNRRHPRGHAAQHRQPHRQHLHSGCAGRGARGPVPGVRQRGLHPLQALHDVGQPVGYGEFGAALQGGHDRCAQGLSVLLAGQLGGAGRPDRGQGTHNPGQEQAGRQDEARGPEDEPHPYAGGGTDACGHRQRQVGAHHQVPHGVDVRAHPGQYLAAAQAGQRVGAGGRQDPVEMGAQGGHAPQGGVMGDKTLAIAQHGAANPEEAHHDRGDPQGGDIGHLGGSSNEPGGDPGQGDGAEQPQATSEDGQGEALAVQVQQAHGAGRGVRGRSGPGSWALLRRSAHHGRGAVSRSRFGRGGGDLNEVVGQGQ